jgi:alkylhydroperoxidase family enzyme
MPADTLPVEWTLGDPPMYTGLDLTHLICRNCKWSAAADANLAYMQNLEWLDISYNPLAEAARTLPQTWDMLPLVAVKVCRGLCTEYCRCMQFQRHPNSVQSPV